MCIRDRFSPIQLLSHSHCSSYPSSCCPTPTVLTHPAAVPHPLFFSPIQLLSHTHCSSYPSSCCPTPVSFLTYRLLSHTHFSHPSAHCPTPTPELLSLLPLITLNYSLSSTYCREGFCFIFVFKCMQTHTRAHTHTHAQSHSLC